MSWGIKAVTQCRMADGRKLQHQDVMFPAVGEILTEEEMLAKLMINVVNHCIDHGYVILNWKFYPIGGIGA